MSTSRYTYEQFVKVWLESESVADVAAKLQVSKHTAERVARKLRKEGVDLPTMRANPLHDPIDADKLNDLIKSKLSA